MNDGPDNEFAVLGYNMLRGVNFRHVPGTINLQKFM